MFSCKLENFKLLENNFTALINIYSGPSLSGHSEVRTPSLMWLQSFGAATGTMNAFGSPSCQRPPFLWPQFLGKLGGFIRGGLLYLLFWTFP